MHLTFVRGLRSLFEGFLGKNIFDFSQEALGVWFAAAQRVEMDTVGVEVDFRADQSMQPIWIDCERMSKYVDSAIVVGAPQEEDLSMGMCLQIELPTFGKAPSPRRRFDALCMALAMRGDVTCRSALQPPKRAMPKPSPNLRLPRVVEALDTRLKTSFVGWCKNRSDRQAEAQPTDTSHDIGILLRSLEAVVVVELDERRQSHGLPVFHQRSNHRFGVHVLCRPGCRQAAVQRNPRQN